MTESRNVNDERPPSKRRWRYILAIVILVGALMAFFAPGTPGFDAMKQRLTDYYIHQMVKKLPGAAPSPRGPESFLSSVAPPDFPGGIGARDCDKDQSCIAARPISPDPHNMSGVWSVYVIRTTIRPDVGARDDGLAPYKPETEKLVIHRVELDAKGTPVPDSGIYCRPLTLAKLIAFPFLSEILQTSDRIYQVFEEWHDFRTIHLDRPHPAKLEPTYLGDSVGHWEVDTLIVDTVGFNDQGWLDMFGSPHGKQLHMSERIRKIDGGRSLEDIVTFEDPEFYSRPFTERIVYQRRGGSYIPERVCEQAVRGVIVDGLVVQ